MAEEEQDQIVFVMVGGERRLHKSVGAGVGQPAVEDILRLEARWIEVDGSQWINRDHVLYMYLSRAGKESGGVTY